MKTILFRGDSITDCKRPYKENPNFFEKAYKIIMKRNMFDEAAAKSPSAKLLRDGVCPTNKGHKLIKEQWLKAFEEIV